MNKPKWLELILLSFWMMPPIIVAAMICRYFRFSFLVYCMIAILALVVWLGIILGWSWLTSARDANTHDDKEAR